MIDLTERYELIKSVCENLKLQTKPKLRIKNQHQVITSHKPKVRRIPSWCLDKLPCDAQILGDDGMYSYVYH
ncbi:TPA: hypothetical protein ACP4RK_000911 [Escherichia coli]|uniref:hypothetical protein n=1 Tax=Escherichia coli TaxID=562 RepID=UPI00198FB374|nr:hypothetical protein [Escherichia coli]EEW1253197.1 hypothetical protein [Escherichia coli]EGE2722184.1 hypothetical protein [Escherichia coli]EJU0095738.1 hypothetical protein [Escherichia coli]MCV8142660.1 hypothetical protein [Escherichia coli]MDO2711109.1 hypothetical protein [Escherichia coli]